MSNIIEYNNHVYHVGQKDGCPWLSVDYKFVEPLTDAQAKNPDNTIRDYILGRKFQSGNQEVLNNLSEEANKKLTQPQVTPCPVHVYCRCHYSILSSAGLFDKLYEFIGPFHIQQTIEEGYNKVFQIWFWTDKVEIVEGDKREVELIAAYLDDPNKLTFQIRKI